MPIPTPVVRNGTLSIAASLSAKAKRKLLKADMQQIGVAMRQGAIGNIHAQVKTSGKLLGPNAAATLQKKRAWRKKGLLFGKKIRVLVAKQGRFLQLKNYPITLKKTTQGWRITVRSVARTDSGQSLYALVTQHRKYSAWLKARGKHAAKIRTLLRKAIRRTRG